MLQGKHPVLHLINHAGRSGNSALYCVVTHSAAPNAQIDGIMLKEITAFHQIRAFT